MFPAQDHVVHVEAVAPIRLSRSALFEGHALAVLQALPSESVRCAITSPPYWGLRDYGIAGQIGLEPSLPQFLNQLTRIFSEVRRVLTTDGTLWLNIGDGYTSGNRGYRATDRKNPARAMVTRPPTPDGLKPKDLVGVPWRLAFALQDDGWFLRSDVVWNKPNAMPESVKDRPTRTHEYLFMLTKSERYHYDHGAVREPTDDGRAMRSRRSVWNVNTKAFAGAHFATFPPELIRPCVLASTEPGDFVLDPFFGSGTVGLVSQQESRQYIGIELNPEYIRMAASRLQGRQSNVLRLAANG